MAEAIGMIEMTSVALGHQVQDVMLKTADVKLLIARTICSGKYIVVVGGGVASVQVSVRAGLAEAPDGVIDHLVIPSIHPTVFAAMGEMVQLNVKQDQIPSLGIIETFSAASAIEAADAAVKAANVTLFRLHVAMALGGKGLVMLSGNVADCRAAIDAGAAVVRGKGLLVASVVIARPSRELFGEHL